LLSSLAATKYKMTLNLKTTNALHLDIPASVLARIGDAI
jgi:hypothetical protein